MRTPFICLFAAFHLLVIPTQVFAAEAVPAKMASHPFPSSEDTIAVENPLFAVKQEIPQGLSLQERQAFYHQHKINVFESVALNLIPFAPASYQQEEWGWAIATSLLDAIWVGFAGASIYSLANGSFGGGAYAEYALLVTTVVPFVLARLVGMSSIFYTSSQHNQVLRDRLQLTADLEEASRANLVSVKWSF